MSAIMSVESFGASKKKETTFTPKVIVATVLMLVSGTMNTLSFKLQNQRNFKHGIVQTWNFFD